MFPEFPRYPKRLSREDFYPIAYRYMYVTHQLDERFKELFKKGQVKGTVTNSRGAEASATGMAMPFRPGKDPVSLLHRDLAANLIWGMKPYAILCQFMANAESPTHGREGNVHHGDAAMRRFPMISHLGNMLAPAVGATWAARKNGEDAFGLAVIGDGGTSTGDFHESLNMASVRKAPVLFVIENNKYAFSTPTHEQYNCEKLSDRAKSYGIPGITIDGTDVWEVYQATCDALDAMAQSSLPYIIESDCLRLEGHAAYDEALYITKEEMDKWLPREPVAKARKELLGIPDYDEARVAAMENEVRESLRQDIARALNVARPNPVSPAWDTYAPAQQTTTDAFKASKVKNGAAVTRALDFILERRKDACILGQDIGQYGSAFKTCKGLFDKYGKDQVVNTPICESATVGFALGASQVGVRPVIEFQFADFSTEAVTQLGLNAGTWYFRSGMPAPMLLRFPCGGGITLGAFHSGEYDGLWSRFPGLKLLYPYTAQETFEAIVAGFYDPNPCLVFENKLMYWSKDSNIDFDGDLTNIFRPRRYREGDDITIVATGAMVDVALSAAENAGCSADVWNPYILKPLMVGPLAESVAKTGRLLVVQESTEIAGLGDHMISRIVQSNFGSLKCAPRLVAPPDTPVPFARELERHYLPDSAQVEQAIANMIGERC